MRFFPTIDPNPCHKGQSKRAGPCPASYSGACTCDRGGGHPGKCHCGHCGRYFVGSIGGDP